MFGFGQSKKKAKRKKVCAVLPCAGSSSRMGGEDKLLAEIQETPVLVHTVAVFEQCRLIDSVIIVCQEDKIIPYGKLFRTYGFTKVGNIICGGPSRAHSVLAGIAACPEDTGYVAIHDGARPLLPQQVLEETLEAAFEHRAAAPVVALKDSIKRVENGKIVQDIARGSIAAVQTPQIFERELIQTALEAAIRAGAAVTDDCAAAELQGHLVATVPGSYDNIKITTPEDLVIAESILSRREYE